MKRIILIDIDCMYVDSISKSEKIYIDTIIVGSNKEKIDIESRYNIDNVLSAESINEFYTSLEINLDYSIIKLFRHTQLKAEHFFSRKTTDINSIQYIYYCALSYYFEKFKKDEIDAVFSGGIEFGSTFDSVIFDVAKYYNKNIFIIEVAFNNGNKIANQILDYTNKKYIRVNTEENNLKMLNLDDFLFNSKVAINKRKRKTVKNMLMQFPEKYGGYLLIMFLAKLIGKYKSIHHTFNTSYWLQLKNYFYIKNMIKYYNSLSTTFDKSKNYVYYSLHMEPEASTLARTVFANQLVIIKSISQNLPKGWILYVKEHPHQFSKLNNFERYFYLASIEKFKTKRYYDEIVKLDNVELLDIEIKSKDIIEHAQAISTINGTITLEAIVLKKPILLFSQNTTPFQNLRNINNIQNSIDLEKVIDKIKSNNVVEYEDLHDLINNYFFEVEFGKNNGYKELVENLIVTGRDE